jgi:hypothetical protein
VAGANVDATARTTTTVNMNTNIHNSNTTSNTINITKNSIITETSAANYNAPTAHNAPVNRVNYFKGQSLLF